MNKRKLRSLDLIHSSFTPINGHGDTKSPDVSPKRSKRRLSKACIKGCDSRCNCSSPHFLHTNGPSLSTHSTPLGSPNKLDLFPVVRLNRSFSLTSTEGQVAGFSVDGIDLILDSPSTTFKLPPSLLDSSNPSSQCLHNSDLCASPAFVSGLPVNGLEKSPESSNGFHDTTESTSVADSVTTTGTSATPPVGSVVCKWFGCDCEIPTSGSVNGEGSELLDHILSKHVKSQNSRRRKYFTCQWTDCKVYRRPSLSYSWLENHILSHTGSRCKPFKCIFDCPLRFSTQKLLERHVRTHLPVSPPKIKSATRLENGSVDLLSSAVSEAETAQDKQPSISTGNVIRRRRRRKRCRGFRARVPDFYDRRSQAFIKNHLTLHSMRPPSEVLENGLTWRGLKSPQISHHNAVSSKSNNLSPGARRLLTFPHAVIGRRLLPGHPTELLIQWFTQDKCCPREWLPEADLLIAKELGAIKKKK